MNERKKIAPNLCKSTKLVHHISKRLCYSVYVSCREEKKMHLGKKSDGRRLSSEGKKAAQRRYNLTLLALCVPGLICLFLFNYLPMGGIIIAFKKYAPMKGLLASKWVGFKNFEFFFTSQDLFRTMRNTVLYSITFLIADLVFGVLIAVLLYNLRTKAGLKVYHTIIMIPRFMSIIVIAYIVYAFLSPQNGVLNKIIVALGGTAIQWYTEPKYWPSILAIVHIWASIGAGCLYYYSALTNTDPTLYEAAEIDGANVLQRTWHISIPELIPIMVMMTILGIGGLFNGDIGLFYQVPRNTGVLYPTTDVINTYTYRALLAGSLEKSAAVGLFQSVVGLLLVVGTNAIVRKVSPENSMF